MVETRFLMIRLGEPNIWNQRESYLLVPEFRVAKKVPVVVQALCQAAAPKLGTMSKLSSKIFPQRLKMEPPAVIGWVKVALATMLKWSTMVSNMVICN